MAHVESASTPEGAALSDAVIAASPLGHAFLDRDLRYVHVNETLARLNGKSVEEHLSRSVREVNARFADVFEPRLRQVIQTGALLRNLEVRGFGDEESARYWLVNAFPVRANTAGIIGVGVAVLDITTQKRTEAHLREAEARFRTLVQGNIIGVVLAEAERIVEANQAFLDMVGYTSGDLQAGRIDWQAMTPPEYSDRDQQALVELYERGACTPFEKEYVRPDGSRVPILIGASLLERDPLRWMCFVVDLSERQHREQQLADLLERERRAHTRLERLEAVTAGLAQRRGRPTSRR